MRSRWGWALPVGVGLGAVAAKVVLSAPQLPEGPALVAITWLVTASYVAVGLALLATDVPAANGWACLLVAWAAVPGDLNAEPYVGAGAATAVGFVLEPMYLPAAVALALRYPRPRLEAGGRALVVALLAATAPVRLATVLTRGPLPDGWHRPPGAVGLDLARLHDDVLVRGGRALATVLLLVAAVALVRRAVRARGVSRQSVIPLTVVGAVTALAAAVDQAIWATGALRGLPADLVRNLAAAILPAALLADLLRRRTAVATVTTLVLRAARSGDLDTTAAVLRRVLRAPGITLHPPGTPTRDGDVEIHDADGAALAVLVVDRREVDDEQLLAAAHDATRAGLENARLASDLRRRNEELVRSRSRIVEAAVAERRRLERDLHDGAQQGFLAVSATLARARLVDDDAVRGVVAEAREGLAVALEELRRLARGIHPAALSQAGLGAALPAVCAPSGARLVVDLGSPGRRLPPAVETTAYFVVAEALTNAARYAPGAPVEVRVAADDRCLEVVVSDTGPGGAALRPGGGLAGLLDRVAALGGGVEVRSGPGGTRVAARLPLEEPAGASATGRAHDTEEDRP